MTAILDEDMNKKRPSEGPKDGEKEVLDRLLGDYGKAKILSREEICELYREYEELAEELKKVDSLDDPKAVDRERKRLERKRQAIRNTVISSNLRLVISLAKKYRGKNLGEFEDLVQNGMLGLLKAAEKFNYKLGYKFSTYAQWWVKQAITREGMMTEKNLVIMPISRLGVINNLSGVQADLMRRGVVRPSLEVLAKELGITAEKVEKLLRFREGMQISSLDEPIEGDEGMTHIDRLRNEQTNGMDVEANMIRQESAAIATALLGVLDERERFVLERRYGIGRDDGIEESLKEIGDVLGVTKERVRQIELKTLAKLRERLMHEAQSS